MRERILLWLILFGLGVFLYIFQNHINTTKGFTILCVCMVVYGLYSIAATKYQKRKLKKNPHNPFHKQKRNNSPHIQIHQ